MKCIHCGQDDAAKFGKDRKGHAGQRNQSDTWAFADKLRVAVSGNPEINTDGFSSYTFIIPYTFGTGCNYAQIIKNFQSQGGNAAAIRYSPGSITSVEKKLICGNIAESDMGTSRIPGAQAVLELRTIHINGDWDSFQQFRFQIENNRLYPYTAIAVTAA